MERFLKLLPAAIAGCPARHVLEPRHDSFKNIEFVRLARAYYKLAHASTDGMVERITQSRAYQTCVRALGSLDADLNDRSFIS